ncbi:UDP-N-acetylmuramoyl-tripeptide--D-alanyl-D-alanine ligase [Mucilaginibacter gotjawali]|uniref:UDP-N-acetylmuramoyl-tripeptide--D-alanyl-D-alanine ligase n=1 Tax=Mucilaginibacter gotjawali TaxID=1550579 RepID=A0A839SEG7_9SPHI|nr:UDP-N-acetylmuramoyl-tripeptide--D-alanyl-D-alanine ligase [Mucilaginibacter gotjawali]MBB3056685.1 UDP-N-acetylmuramoyl-tripeptide--D-alanyl-D-alanine ligase [Mucilaginibacter gotjawali]
MTNTEQLYTLFLQHPLIITDTRKILPGSLFFALKGEKFDANTFAEKAIEAGAAYAIIDNPVYQLNEKYLLVDDVLTALQDLARHHRRQLTIPVIGLTGTNGKTTTKELINSVLSQHFKTQATQGNLNNHIGVPLSILTIDASHEMAVIEMGANHQKEIEFLCGIAQPSHGLITNVGKAHLEGFGGFEGVKKGKGELYDFLKKSENPQVRKSEEQDGSGIAFINRDNPDLIEMEQLRGLQNVVYYGKSSANNLVNGEIIENSPLLTLKWANNHTGKSNLVKTQLTGAYNLDNILAAICIGVYFKLSDEEINKGVEDYQPKNNRSQIMQTATNTLICDYYNANPSSMQVAIENIGKIKADRKVLILGDMFELGDEAAAEHTAIIQKAMETPVDQRIFIGKEFALAGATMDHGPWTMDKNVFFDTAEDAVAALKANPIKNSTILVKGSRGMALERLVELF